MNQRTIKQAFTLEGIGLHSGKPAAVTIKPAAANSGLTINHLPATVARLSGAERMTALGDISLVEHLLSAVYGLEIDNLAIEVDGAELPVMDGSALPFAEALEQAGILEQNTRKNYLTPHQPICLSDGSASLEALPYHGFKIEFVVKFKGIGEQFFSFDMEKQSYREEVSPARTFGFIEEYEDLKRRGLALGASYDNALVLSKSGYVNQPRFPDEVVRHKILDLIGDLALLGFPLKAQIKAACSGHKLNAELVRRILEQ
jgi:UDP-3-O-acyl N-acetylglucosamine deacetylase